MSFEEQVPYSGFLIHENGREVKCTGQVIEIDGGRAYKTFTPPMPEEPLEDGPCQLRIHDHLFPGRMEGGTWFAQQ